MAIVMYMFYTFLLYLSYIKVSNGINLGENSIEYDSLSKFEYKVGEEITFFKYTDIKGIRSDECIPIYEGILYNQDNSPASYIDYYFSSIDTIVAIIPDVPPSNDYSIAFKVGSYYSDNYIYSHRFKIIPGGKIKKMTSHIDACGIERVSIYGEDIPEKKTKTKTNKDNEANKTIIIIQTPASNSTIATNTTSIATTIDSKNQNSSNSNGENKYNKSTIDNQVKAPSNVFKQSSSNTDKKSNIINYIVVFVTGVCFCGLVVVGYIYINKKGRERIGTKLESISDNNNDYIPSPKMDNDNIELTIPSDYGYQPNIKNTKNEEIPKSKIKNEEIPESNHSIKTQITGGTNANSSTELITPKLNSSRDLFNVSSPIAAVDRRLTLRSDASLVPSSNLLSSVASLSPQSYSVNAPSVNVLEPIETPSTEIKFVATSSYQPKNSNEIAVSSLDIIYLVGYVDETYAQILNITNNNYGIIPISELNKIQP